MPFTPLHMGPGMLVKAAMPKHFSIVVFALTQIALDLEVLWRLAAGGYPLHGTCHTFLGATILGGLLALLGKPLSQRIKRFWNRIAARCCDADLRVPVVTTWTATVLGAAVGALSHIALDSLYHPDIEPFQPWWDANPLRGVISPPAVELACLASGILGLAWFFGRARHRQENPADANATASSLPDADTALRND